MMSALKADAPNQSSTARSDLRLQMVQSLRWSLGVNLLMAAVKFAGAYFGNSDALMADAVESINDLFSSVLMLFGLRYAMRPADREHPYGHGRAEPLLTFAAVLLLLISSGLIAKNSIQNLQHPAVTPAWWTLLILALVVISKQAISSRLQARAQSSHSSLLSAEAWHHRSDAISSAIAFVGILLALLFGPKWAVADDWAALAAAVFIAYNAWVLFRTAFGEIMDEQVYSERIAQIRSLALEVEGVRGTEKCVLRKTGMVFLADLHLLVDGNLSVAEGHRIAHLTVDHLKSGLPELESVFIHVEPAATLP